jgi:hypothetical protein
VFRPGVVVDVEVLGAVCIAQDDVAIVAAQVDGGLIGVPVVLLSRSEQHDVAIRGFSAEPEIATVPLEYGIDVSIRVANPDAGRVAAKMDGGLGGVLVVLLSRGEMSPLAAFPPSQTSPLPPSINAWTFPTESRNRTVLPSPFRWMVALAVSRLLSSPEANRTMSPSAAFPPSQRLPLAPSSKA